jgi:hypothetical protein
MSERSAQCHECADVFTCGPTGRLPHLCPKCRGESKEREPADAARKPAKRAKAAPRATNGGGSIGDALTALRGDLEATMGRVALLEEAIETMEKLVA